MKLGMRPRVVGDLEQGQKDVVQNVLEVGHQLVQLEYIAAQEDRHVKTRQAQEKPRQLTIIEGSVSTSAHCPNTRHRRWPTWPTCPTRRNFCRRWTV